MAATAQFRALGRSNRLWFISSSSAASHDDQRLSFGRQGFVSGLGDADQILVIEDGRQVGLGTHHELLADCPTYAEIVASQLTEEEAA